MTHRGTSSYRGSKQKHAKLTEEQVARIRIIHKPWSRQFGIWSLAREYNVSVSTIRRIIARESWTHVL